jgi:hypothetical protein
MLPCIIIIIIIIIVIIIIIGLVNDAFDNTDCTVSNGRIISEEWIRNDVEGSGHGLHEGGICLEENWETTKASG